MRPAVFSGQVSSVWCFFPPLNCIRCSFCSRLASRVRVNFLPLFLRCSTQLSMLDELSVNKWHTINHALLSLAACVKRRCAVPQEKFLCFFFAQSCFLFCCCFLYICVFLWHSCPFASFHQGLDSSVTSVVHIKSIEWQENEWERGSNNTHLPRNNNNRGGLMQDIYCFRCQEVEYFWLSSKCFVFLKWEYHFWILCRAVCSSWNSL